MKKVSRNKINRNSIRKKATQLLQECQISNPPVKLSIILRYLGVNAIKADPRMIDVIKISAFIVLEEKLIVYSDSDPTVRKRFGVAHEIGHYILNHNTPNHSLNLTSADPKETEANIFASELLIPYEWIKKDMSWDSKIPDLAKKYWVSQEAMGWRLYKSSNLL